MVRLVLSENWDRLLFAVETRMKMEKKCRPNSPMLKWAREIEDEAWNRCYSCEDLLDKMEE
jgi:hypothetical protein